MLPRISVPFATVVFAALAILLTARGASGADPGRGSALYESRCGTCHSESVHGRKKRVAADFDDVRGWVIRWNENLELHWGDDEIDDVTVYLNNTYYHYTCPPRVCKVVSLAPPRSGELRSHLAGSISLP
jgi:mono/diheme cytochrome c family protein